MTQTTTVPGTTVWTIDAAHSNVEFAVRHMMIANVKGRFADIRGSVVLDEAHPARSTVDVTIGTASIDTRQEQRDQHLRSADFFDAAQYPDIRFVSKRIDEKGDGEYKVTGDLTIRGVTREVVLTASEEGRTKDPWGNNRVAYSATTKINRKDFGLTWNQVLETGGVVVGDEIRISLDVELVQQKSE
jgi:polyisoprenoid-binding protein YceI